MTDVEVFQEILHRYGAIQRKDAIQPAFDALTGMVDAIFPIEHEDVLIAKDIMLGSDRLSSRDALHLAVMNRRNIDRIFSFDSGFDSHPGITRITDRL